MQPGGGSAFSASCFASCFAGDNSMRPARRCGEAWTIRGRIRPSRDARILYMSGAEKQQDFRFAAAGIGGRSRQSNCRDQGACSTLFKRTDSLSVFERTTSAPLPLPHVSPAMSLPPMSLPLSPPMSLRLFKVLQLESPARYDGDRASACRWAIRMATAAMARDSAGSGWLMDRMAAQTSTILPATIRSTTCACVQPGCSAR